VGQTVGQHNPFLKGYTKTPAIICTCTEMLWTYW